MPQAKGTHPRLEKHPPVEAALDAGRYKRLTSIGESSAKTLSKEIIDSGGDYSDKGNAFAASDLRIKKEKSKSN